MSAKTQVRPGGRPHEHVSRLADRVVECWYGHHGGHDLEIAISVVAALYLLDVPREMRQEVVDDSARRGPEQFPHAMRELWSKFMRGRPDLVNPVWPLVGPWFDEERPIDGQKLIAAKAVADAALRYDVLGFEHNREDVDLLGELLTRLRPQSSLQARGQFYTPPAVCELMAAMTIGVLDEGESICDPALGTGGMWRGAAVAMRQAGRNPHTVTWVGNDLDHIAIACAAVNAVVWDLGPNVVLDVADTLTEPDWITRAIHKRNETLAIAQGSRTVRLMDRLLSGDLGPDDLAPKLPPLPKPLPVPEPTPAAEPVRPVALQVVREPDEPKASPVTEQRPAAPRTATTPRRTAAAREPGGWNERWSEDGELLAMDGVKGGVA